MHIHIYIHTYILSSKPKTKLTSTLSRWLFWCATPRLVCNQFLTLAPSLLWQTFDHPLGCRTSAATCGGSGPSSTRKKVVLLTKFYGYIVMRPWGYSPNDFQNQAWINGSWSPPLFMPQSCTKEISNLFRMNHFTSCEQLQWLLPSQRLREAQGLALGFWVLSHGWSW